MTDKIFDAVYSNKLGFILIKEITEPTLFWDILTDNVYLVVGENIAIVSNEMLNNAKPVYLFKLLHLFFPCGLEVSQYDSWYVNTTNPNLFITRPKPCDYHLLDLYKKFDNQDYYLNVSTCSTNIERTNQYDIETSRNEFGHYYLYNPDKYLLIYDSVSDRKLFYLTEKDRFLNVSDKETIVYDIFNRNYYKWNPLDLSINQVLTEAFDNKLPVGFLTDLSGICTTFKNVRVFFDKMPKRDEKTRFEPYNLNTDRKYVIWGSDSMSDRLEKFDINSIRNNKSDASDIHSTILQTFEYNFDYLGTVNNHVFIEKCKEKVYMPSGLLKTSNELIYRYKEAISGEYIGNSKNNFIDAFVLLMVENEKIVAKYDNKIYYNEKAESGDLEEIKAYDILHKKIITENTLVKNVYNDKFYSVYFSGNTEFILEISTNNENTLKKLREISRKCFLLNKNNRIVHTNLFVDI